MSHVPVPTPPGEKGLIVSSPLDEHGLDLFEETASAAGSFPTALRGYERGSVDAYVKEVEAKLSRVLNELRATQYRLATAEASVDTTDYSRVGGHARSLLKSAEAQAAEILQSAQAEADRIRTEAGIEHSRTTNQAHLTADATRAAGIADLDQLRELLGEQTAAELEAARTEAAALREATERQREWLLREGETQARSVIDAAVADAEHRRAEIDRLAAEQTAELAGAREAALAEIAAGRQTAADQIAELIAEAKQQAEEYQARLEADVQTADQRREAARAEAAEITRAATEQAQLTIETAQHESGRILAEATREAAERAERLEREVQALDLRKQGIIDQLEQLSSLATESAQQYPDQAAETSSKP